MAAVAAVGAVGGAVVTASPRVREGQGGGWVGRSVSGSGISVLAIAMSKVLPFQA